MIWSRIASCSFSKLIGLERFCIAQVLIFAFIVCTSAQSPSPAPSSVRSSQYNIYTLAGTGGSGTSSNTDGVAATATLNDPRSVWRDSLGIVYIVETGGNCIRKFAASDNIIKSFAGTCGISGYNGDNIQATSAQFVQPHVLVGDTMGTKYISDYAQHRVRKIGADGIITGLTGTGSCTSSGNGADASSAGFPNPRGIHVDSTGKIYLIEYFNHIIRVIGTSNIINLYAGESSHSQK